MEERSLWHDLRELLKNISGTWHAADRNETMAFSPCEKSNQDAQLIISGNGKAPLTTIYSVGSYLPESLEAVFFIDIGAHWNDKVWYKIKEASASKMVLIEISRSAGRKEIGSEISYNKK